MPVQFHRTLRSLESERSVRLVIGLAAVVLLGCLWLIWMLTAELPVFVVSDRAQLETVQLETVQGAPAGPPAELRASGWFSAAEALGRIHPGQSAQLRLDGFPWTRYGSLEATVEQVSGEVQDGRFRVVAAFERRPDLAIPLQPGMPGTLIVEVERVAPADLVQRNAGGRATAGDRNPRR